MIILSNLFWCFAQQLSLTESLECFAWGKWAGSHSTVLNIMNAIHRYVQVHCLIFLIWWEVSTSFTKFTTDNVNVHMFSKQTNKGGRERERERERERGERGNRRRKYSEKAAHKLSLLHVFFYSLNSLDVLPVLCLCMSSTWVQCVFRLLLRVWPDWRTKYDAKQNHVLYLNCANVGNVGFKTAWLPGPFIPLLSMQSVKSIILFFLIIFF